MISLGLLERTIRAVLTEAAEREIGKRDLRLVVSWPPPVTLEFPVFRHRVSVDRVFVERPGMVSVRHLGTSGGIALYG